MTDVYGRADVDTVSSQGDRYFLYYYRDRVDLQEDYLDNKHQMARIKKIMSLSPRIDSIVVYAYSSPEGTPQRNNFLARERAKVARQFILDHLPNDSVLQPEDIILRPMGENWDGLKKELQDNYHLMNRDRVLKILDADVNTETKKWRFKNLDNGFTWKWIIQHHMPKLRIATWVCVYVPTPELIEDSTFADDQHVEIVVPQDSVVPADTVKPQEQLPVAKQHRFPVLALKTNMLYDALTLLNYSIEVPFNEKFSVLWYHQFPWWRWGEADNEYCIRFLSIGAEGRWWFTPQPRPQMGMRVQRDRLMGHFVGLYAESGKWDFEWGREICHQGEHWSVGLSYGYSMPLGRRLNMEFSISVGYASIPYRKFTPSGDYEILWRDPEKYGRWHYFGPTKAQVSLVVPITMKTKRKGGAR
jgi:hypothetical protein